MATIASRADCAHLTRGPTTPMPRLWAVLALTGTFMVLEAVGGWVSGSPAPPAHAGPMLPAPGALRLSPLPPSVPPPPPRFGRAAGRPRAERPAARPSAPPRHVVLADVHRRILGVAGVAAVHDLHVWTVVNGVVAMSGHAVVPDLVAHPGVLEGIRTE